MKIIIQLAYILLSLVSVLLGFAIVYWISGRIDYQWTLWGCTVFVFFFTVIGIGETVVGGLVAATMITILNYFIMKVNPELLPIIGGALVGFIPGAMVFARLMDLSENHRQARKQQAWQAYRDYVKHCRSQSPKWISATFCKPFAHI